MNIITEFIKKKIIQFKKNPLTQIKDTPPVNMTGILLNPKNILILPFNRMGTILLATRVFKSVRDHYPDAKITVGVHEPWSVLISKDPTVDEVIAFSDDIEDPYSKGFQEIGEALASKNFDLTFFLSYQNDPSMAFLTSLTNSNLRVSFRGNYEAQYFNIEIVPATGIRYEADRYLEMLRTIGIHATMRDYTMKISDAIREKAQLRYLSSFSKADMNRFIGFDLTKEITGDPINKKNAENILTALNSGFDATIIIFFEPGKKGMVAELKQTYGKKIIVVEDRPVSIVAGLMSFCRFVVTHNTDLFQLAVALKIPSIALLTQEETIQWSPGENDHIVHLERSSGTWPQPTAIYQSAKTLLSINQKS